MNLNAAACLSQVVCFEARNQHASCGVAVFDLDWTLMLSWCNLCDSVYVHGRSTP